MELMVWRVKGPQWWRKGTEAGARSRMLTSWPASRKQRGVIRLSKPTLNDIFPRTRAHMPPTGDGVIRCPKLIGNVSLKPPHRSSRSQPCLQVKRPPESRQAPSSHSVVFLGSVGDEELSL